MKYLGIDYGAAHIGIAIGDDEIHFAVPLETIPHTGMENVCHHLSIIAKNEGIEKIIVGVPTLGQVFGAQRKTIEEAIVCMRASIQIPIESADESFTTKEAQRLMRDTGQKDTDEHAIAASLILQNYLDKNSTS